MKKLDTKKYFLYALPTAIIYRIIAYFTIDAFIGGWTAKCINYIVIVAILFGSLLLSRKEK